jgi:hypothetical protein
MGCLGPILYGLVKTGAYMGWSYWGAKIHGHHDRLLLKGVLYGLIRVVMGGVLGLVLILWLVNMLSQATHSSVLLYLAVYVPVRWMEWSIMAVVMDREHRSLKNFLVGRTGSSLLWRAGGIVISCLADVPMMIVTGGLPIGRFMC